jgi:hypothetical protein
LDYAVERGLLDTNPLEKLKKKRLPPSPAIDRRRVANPRQARALLAAVHENDPSLEAFFATMYFPGPRPAEVLALRRRDCSLLKRGGVYCCCRRPIKGPTNGGMTTVTASKSGSSSTAHPKTHVRFLPIQTW